MTDWNPIDEPCDRLLLAGRMSPGICEVVNADSPRDWEERRGYGVSGATVIFRGVKLSHFIVRFHLYTPIDWADWRAFKPLLDKPPHGQRPKGMDVWHPLLVDLGIRACVVENCKQPDQTADGVWTIEVQLIEFREPKPALAKPVSSAAAAAPAASTDRIAQLMAQLAANQKLIEELAGQ